MHISSNSLRKFRLPTLALLALLLTGLVTSVPSSTLAQAEDDRQEGRQGSWASWGHDLLGSRFNPLADVNPENVNKLKLAWSFVFPDTTTASSQPAVIGDTLYVGSWNGKVYALNAKTGKQKWVYDTASYTHITTPGVNGVRTGPAFEDGKIFVGDLLANVYALDADTGALKWATKVETHPAARITSSPLVFEGRVYVGVSSTETAFALSPAYPCCSFRGSMVALDTKTGAVSWRYYTISQSAAPLPGTNGYGPSGAPVWGSPALDPISGTLYFGTGQNYSNPATNRSDSLIALNARTGQERWATQLTPNDRWNVACNPEILGFPATVGPNCPLPQTPNLADWDIGYSPNVFVTFKDGKFRQLVGAGQKSGIYHALDAKTGEIVWQRQLSVSGVGGLGGIQWGGSWDGQRLYVATNQAGPGSLNALDPATGKVLWRSPNPADGCTTGGGASDPNNCRLALPAAVTTVPGLAIEGSQDGKLRIYNSRSGLVMWQYDTAQSFTGTNGLTGKGGSISGGGATAVGNMVYVNSGYGLYPGAGIGGNVLLAFAAK